LLPTAVLPTRPKIFLLARTKNFAAGKNLLFTSHNTPHITLGNEQCLKLLLGVCNTKKEGRSLWSKLTYEAGAI
jgi:hypothetical protein